MRRKLKEEKREEFKKGKKRESRNETVLEKAKRNDVRDQTGSREKGADGNRPS